MVPCSRPTTLKDITMVYSAAWYLSMADPNFDDSTPSFPKFLTCVAIGLVKRSRPSLIPPALC